VNAKEAPQEGSCPCPQPLNNSTQLCKASAHVHPLPHRCVRGTGRHKQARSRQPAMPGMSRCCYNTQLRVRVVIMLTCLLTGASAAAAPGLACQTVATELPGGQFSQQRGLLATRRPDRSLCRPELAAAPGLLVGTGNGSCNNAHVCTLQQQHAWPHHSAAVGSCTHANAHDVRHSPATEQALDIAQRQACNTASSSAQVSHIIPTAQAQSVAFSTVATNAGACKAEGQMLYQTV
jgi:hypothetical protein